MESCIREECNVIAQLKKMNTKLTILTYMIGILLFIVGWAVYTVATCYEFEYATTTITIDSSDSTGDAIYQDGKGNVINGKNYCEEDQTQP